MGTKEPIRRIQAGQVTCALWENAATVNGKLQTILKATIDRRYLDRDGQWKTSQSFSRNEIPLAIFVLQKAFEAMIDKPSEAGEVERSDVL